MVLEEGLDISSLPKTLKEDFEMLNRMEGRYRVTKYIFELFDLEDLGPRKGPPCSFCTVKALTEKCGGTVEDYKSINTFSKVTLCH